MYSIRSNIELLFSSAKSNQSNNSSLENISEFVRNRGRHLLRRNRAMDYPHWHENWKWSKCGGNPDWSVGKTNPGADKSDLSIRDLSNLPPPHHLTHSPHTVRSLRSDKENPITALKQNIIQTWKKRDLSTNHVSLEKITTKKPNLILNTFKIGLLRLNLALNCYELPPAPQKEQYFGTFRAFYTAFECIITCQLGRLQELWMLLFFRV